MCSVSSPFKRHGLAPFGLLIVKTLTSVPKQLLTQTITLLNAANIFNTLHCNTFIFVYIYVHTFDVYIHMAVLRHSYMILLHNYTVNNFTAVI